MAAVIFVSACSNAQTEKKKITSLKISTLSTMLANPDEPRAVSRGIGEWGYSALVEADGKKILFDTGNRPETVLKNARELKIDLSEVEEVFLSHNHGDHTGGLLTLRRELKKRNPKALSKVHVAEGIFADRMRRSNRMAKMKAELEADGVTFIIHTSAQEIFPGVWTTGIVKRIHPERNWSGRGKIKTAKGDVIEDNIPEDQSLVINTKDGFVLVSGCGHAGIINTLEQIRTNIEPATKVFAAIGGFHLINASDKHLKWTAKKMRGFGVRKIIGADCTGINSLYVLRRLLKLKRNEAVVGSVGDSFDLENGIKPGAIAR